MVLRNFKDKYLIASSGMAGYYDSNIIQTKKIRDKFYICGDFEHEAKEGEGLMAPKSFNMRKSYGEFSNENFN